MIGAACNYSYIPDTLLLNLPEVLCTRFYIQNSSKSVATCMAFFWPGYELNGHHHKVQTHTSDRCD